MLRVVDDSPRAHTALHALWRDPLGVAMLRRRWAQIFPGAPLHRWDDRHLTHQFDAALRLHRLKVIYLRQPLRPPQDAHPERDHQRVMHLNVGGKALLIAPKGQLPASLSAPIVQPGAMLRALANGHPALTSLSQQAARVLPAGLARGNPALLGQKLAAHLASGQAQAMALIKPHLVQQAARLPSAPKPINRMSPKEKIYEALNRSYNLVGKDVRLALDTLRQPQNLAMMVGFMLVLTGVQLIPGVDVVVDFGMLIWLLYTVGTKAVTGIKALVSAVTTAEQAQDEAGMALAARHFATAFEALGEAGISALLAFLQGMRFASRFAKSGEAEAEGVAGAKNATQEAAESKPAKPAKPAVKFGQRGRYREPGASALDEATLRDMASAKLREAEGALKQAGWPDIAGDQAATFKAPPEPITLKPGQKIYRVIDSESNPNGSFWTTADPAKMTEADWRSGAAVKGEWNGDGAYVEYEVPPSGLNVWSGEAAPQMSSDGVSVLKGGGNQLWLPYGSSSAGSPISTGWTL